MAQTAQALARNHLDRRRLMRAVRHVNSHWLPFNPQVVDELKDGSLYEAVATDPEQLLAVLKKDYGLFAFLLVKILGDNDGTSRDGPVQGDPSPLFKVVGPKRLQQLVADGCQISSTHQLKTAFPFQLSRLAETVVVASTVESLCRSAQLDPHRGFCRAVLHELGLNLIAWNYPSVFEAALESLDAFNKLEDIIKQTLGFSPEELAQALTSNSRQSGGGDRPFANPEDQPLEDFISIGKALARAEFPEVYPSASRDWRYAYEYLKEILGKLFPTALRDTIERNASGYARLMPHQFKRLSHFHPARHHGSGSPESRMMFNPYVKQCPTMVRTALTSFYEGMPEGGPDTSRLSNLLTKVVPLAGFTGGCLFLISRKKGALVPGAIIGRVRAIEVDSVPLGSITRKSSSLDSASSANGNKSRSMIEQTFLSRRSMFERARPLGAKDPASILALIARFSATIGEKNPVGVLYLEKPLSDNPEDEADSLIAFRAINRTISDSLYIE